MVSEKELYKNKQSFDPWGQLRASQKLRRQNYIEDLKSFFHDKVFDSGLDIACGSGYLSNDLAQFVNEFTLADYAPNTLELAKKQTNYKYNYIVNTLPATSFNEEFDIIFLIEALYYLHEAEVKSFFDNSYNIIKENGFLVVTLEEDRLTKIDIQFEIKSSFIRYKPLISIGDFFFYISTRLTKIGYLANNKFLSHFINSLTKYCEKTYRSMALAKIELKLGKMLRITHPRQLFILQKKND